MSQLKLFGIVALALALAAMIGTLARTARFADEVQVATGAATHNLDMERGDVVGTIRALGLDRDELERLRAQLEGERALAAARKPVIEKAAQEARQRASGFGRTVARLEASAATQLPTPPRCEPSAALKEQWK